MRAGLGALASLGLVPRAAVARDVVVPLPRALSVRGGRPFAGDRSLLATIAPGVRERGTATVSFTLDRQTRVRLDAVRTGLRRADVEWSTTRLLAPGEHQVAWTPPPDTPVGSYVMRLTMERDGRRRVLGGRRPASADLTRAPVVRVVGIEAAFTRRSYVPTEPMTLRVLADAPALTLEFLRVGHGPDPSLRNDELTGLPMGEPVRMDWTGKRSARHTVRVQSGDWPTGLYAARLTTPDGRVGFAPFVLRPRELGAAQVAAVLPTNTWQAYNFYDSDGDGWGDTWYAGGQPPVRLDRPYRDRGVPLRFRRYDFPFLRWLEKTRAAADVLADDDLEALPSGDELRRLYDLVVLPGHSEYVTEHAYDVLERYRDLGGRLVFLSANNVFWKVTKAGNEMRRHPQWRDLGRPEARLCGVQYRANDDGRRQAPFTVVDAAAAPWLFAGTGLVDGSTFGDEVGGFGIEIDMATPASPPGTRVVARISDHFGPGQHAEMAYYETEAGARVFSAGVLDFPAFLLAPTGFTMLLNIWRHMLADVPPLPPPA